MSKLNGYVVLSLVLSLIGLIVAFVAIQSQAALVISMFVGTGAVIAGVMAVVIYKKVYPAIYPIRLRAYGERYDSFTVTDSTRVKIVRGKDGKEYLESVSGKRFKMPDRKYIVKALGDMYVDVFDSSKQQFPITISYKDDGEERPHIINNEDELIEFLRESYPVQMSRKNIEGIRKEIIPENQRAWFADQVIPSVTEATRPPREKWMQIMEIGLIGAAIMIVIIGVVFAPDYWMKSWQFWKQRTAEVEAQMVEEHNAFMDAVSQSPIVCQCPTGKADIIRPEPPPG
jgi:hypothetical protein